MDKNSVVSIFDEYGTDKGTLSHSYHHAYSSIFNNFTPNSILEIGIHEGRSLASWKKMFPDSIVHGIDMRNTAMIEEAKSIPVFRGNATDNNFMNSVVDRTYDIIIDDADHRPDNQWKVFLTLEDKWSKFYVIEDVIDDINERMLRRRLREKGYTNIVTHTSAANNPKTTIRKTVQIHGKMVYPPFYMMIVQRNA